jgi:hypothetical protein
VVDRKAASGNTGARMLKYCSPVFTAVALHVAVMCVYLVGFHGDVSAFVCLGERWSRDPSYRTISTVIPNDGYDGQFYFAIAQAPLQRHDSGIDFAPMRQSRILYPALSWALAGGDANRLLWTMPLINLLAIGGLAGLGVALAVRYDLNPWWGLVLPLAVNAGLPLLRNLSDVVSTLAVAALLVAWLFRWPWWAVALAALASVLGREQNVPILLIVLTLAAWRRQWLTAASLIAVLLIWVAWIGTLWQMYGTWPFHPTEGAFDRPLAGLWLRLQHFKPFKPDGLCIALILLQIGLSFYLIWRKADPVVVLVALFGSTLALMGGDVFYCDYWSYSRVFAMLPLAVWVGCVQTRLRWPLAVSALQFLVPVAVAIHEMRR